MVKQKHYHKFVVWVCAVISGTIVGESVIQVEHWENHVFYISQF